MLPGESAVTYEGLPIASGSAHTLRRTSPAQGLEAWRTFLTRCTRPEALRGYFSLANIPGLEPPDGALGRVAEHFEPSPEVSDRWVVSAERVDEAVTFYESLGPPPVNDYGVAALRLAILADVTMLHPATGGPWPGQSPARFGEFVTPGGIHLGASRTALFASGKTSLGLSLSFPEATDDDIETLVPWLEDALPIKLSPKHWTRWTRTKKGDSYRSRKINGS
nr:hypothetical protein [Actinomycetales bacterium]